MGFSFTSLYNNYIPYTYNCKCKCPRNKGKQYGVPLFQQGYAQAWLTRWPLLCSLWVVLMHPNDLSCTTLLSDHILDLCLPSLCSVAVQSSKQSKKEPGVILRDPQAVKWLAKCEEFVIISRNDTFTSHSRDCVGGTFLVPIGDVRRCVQQCEVNTTCSVITIPEDHLKVATVCNRNSEVFQGIHASVWIKL